ncbi:MAG: hypothetical protein KatS3mg102_0048 [Planctomycetota bacterium]|nr:MAG: hypothetical protein KatS3mg102_0048 [Planctomycetota bacterium]
MVRLTMEEALRLGRERPQELQRRALAEREEFVFAVRDMRASYGQEWGGELRVLINGNVVLHLLPAFNEHMRDEDELPQFCVMPRGTSSAGEPRAHLRRRRGTRRLPGGDLLRRG